MAELTFETLNFEEEKERIKVILLRQFYFYLSKEDLEKIGKVKVEKEKILFEGTEQRKAEKKFNFLLAEGLKELKNRITNNRAVYVHRNSNIPLIGNVAFGLVYRNTSLIEVKPATGCNLNCLYCSVGEGINSKKTDFVVEKDYLVEEFKELLNFVGEPVEAHIGMHGEPFLYGDIIPLIKDLHGLEKVHTVSLDTNGTLLNKEIVDELSELEKVRLNISLNTLNQETAQSLAGVPYNLKKVLEIIEYAKKKKIKILLTPLIVPGYNDKEIEELVKWAKEKKLPLGIQNFLTYKTGRNPTKPWPWKKFYSFLKNLEEKYKTKLIVSPEDFGIKYTRKLEKPFKIKDVITAAIVCAGRFPHSRIAVAKKRNISLPDCELPEGKKVKIKIIRDKHNIFVGKVI